MLTPKQKEILDFIQEYTKENDFAPSLEEIKQHFRLRSVATVHQHVETLKDKGYLNKEKNQQRSIEVFQIEKMIQIPLLGMVAAGAPIEAITNQEMVAVPKNLLKKPGLHYALKVTGDSMIDEGIHDGDTIIVRKQEVVENGETAIALINNNEATVKKIYFEKNRIRLQPANSAFKPIYVRSLSIQGKVVGVFRNYN